MNRAWLGAWGAGLGPDRFAAAVAALGVLRGRPPGYAARAIEHAWKSSLLRWQWPAAPEDYHAGDLAHAWLTWRGAWWTQNRVPVRAAWRDATPLPRMAVDWPQDEDPGWLVEQLATEAIGPLSVHLAGWLELRPGRWGWPLEVGVLDDRDAHPLLGQAERAGGDSPVDRFAHLRSVAGRGGTCDLLLITSPLRTAASAVLTAGVRAGCVLCLSPPADRWSVTGPLLRALGAHVDAAAIGYSAVAPARQMDWLAALLLGLAAGQPLDVALRRAAHRVGTTAPVLFTSVGFLASTRLAHVTEQAVARARRGAVVRSAGAPLAGPAPPRFIQARVRDAQGEAPEGPLAPGAPHVIQVRIAEPERDWPSAEGPAFPAPSGDVAHRLTVVLIAPAVLSEPLVEEIVLPPRGASTMCSFFVVPGPEDTRLWARIAVLHGNRVLQTAILNAPVGQASGDEGFRLSAEPEAALRQRLDDLESRRPFDAAVLVNHDEDGNPGITTISGERARLLLPSDFPQATKLIYRILEQAVLQPEGYDTLEDPASVELLVVIAAHGHALYKLFLDSEGSQSVLDAHRLQLVLLRHGDDFPLELVYERIAPDPDATLCPQALESLREGRCAGCSPPDDPRVICPMAFWGLTKSIEREPYRGPPDAYHPEIRAVHGDRSAFRSPTGVLFATSQNVRSQDVVALRAALAGAIAGTPQEAESWTEWRQQVAAEHPPLLVLLPHNETHPVMQAPALEIGGDAPLAQLNVRPDVICPDGTHHPFVILLGCNVAATDISLYDFPPEFHRAGASIVLGTVTKVLGRHAAPVAAAIVNELAARSATGDAYITDVIRDLRRSLLAEGRPLGMALVAYGDGDWTVGGG